MFLSCGLVLASLGFEDFIVDVRLDLGESGVLYLLLLGLLPLVLSLPLCELGLLFPERLLLFLVVFELLEVFRIGLFLVSFPLLSFCN